MEENERYLQALNQSLKESLVDQTKNPDLNDDHIKNMMDNVRSAAEHFTKAEDKQTPIQVNVQAPVHSAKEELTLTKKLQAENERLIIELEKTQKSLNIG